MAGESGLQFDMFGAVNETMTREASPPVISSQGWQMPETAAFVAALRRGALMDSLGILNRLKINVAWKVLLESGFTVGKSDSRVNLMAPVQRAIIEAAQRGLSGHELRATKEAEVQRPSILNLVNAESDASLERTRIRQEVRFTQPFVGNTGVQLIGYAWLNRKEEYVDGRGEDRVRTVSDWEQAVVNLDTGRQIVHQFVIKTQEGDEQEVSAETAASLLGISETSVRGNARKLLEHEIVMAKRVAEAVRQADGIDAISAERSPSVAIANRATTYSLNAPMVQRLAENGRKWAAIENRIERESAKQEKYRFLVRDGGYVWSPEVVASGSELFNRGWRNVELSAGAIWPEEKAQAQEPQPDVRKGGTALTVEELRTNSLAADAAELAGQFQEESLEPDFEPADVLAAAREWAKNGGFAEVEMRDALIRELEKRPDFRRKAGVLATLRKGVEIEAKSEVKGKADDAGAELTYNKRNRIKTGIKWSDIKDMETALRVRETAKAKVYPKPDYQALIDSGVQPVHAHIVKQVYDSLAAKPAVRTPSDEQLQAYIDGVNRVMVATLEWAASPDGAGAWNGMRGTGSRLLEMVYPNGWRERKSEIALLGSSRFYSALQPGYEDGRRALKAVKEGWPVAQEAWQKQGYSVVLASEVTASYYEGNRRGTDPYVALTYYVNGKQIYVEDSTIDGATSSNDERVRDEVAAQVSRLTGCYVLLNKRNHLVSVHESESLAKEAARSAVRRGTDAGINEVGIKVEMAVRVGVPRRLSGEDVSSEKLVEVFGFKGVNFGTWMKGKSNEAERQLHVNHIYDAFLDLADTLGVPPKAMSLDGMLGIAVGAQGGGSYAAHFVPGVNEINLTRTSGAGSLAHEFGHALDHYFARMAGLEREGEPYLTEHALRNPVIERHVLVNGKFEHSQLPRFGADLRVEVLERFKGIVEAMRKRPISEAEAEQQQSGSLKRAEVGVERWLGAVRKDFDAQRLKDAVVQRNGATVPVLEAFDGLADRVRRLDLGDGMVAVSRNKAVSPVVAEIRSLYKEVTGRIYSLDNSQGLQMNIDSLRYQRTAENDAVTHVAQKVSTDYLKAAAVLDQGKQTPYWATTVEMFARAFDAYVSDTLENKAVMNTYLSHAGRVDATTPQGDDRKVINTAFDALVGEVRTRETEKGVAMFSYAGQASAAAELYALQTAQARLEAGDDEETVRRETGWFKGVDEKWRFEISDADAEIANGLAYKGTPVGPAASKLIQRLDRPLVLADVLDHPALYAAYPTLAEYGVTFVPKSVVEGHGLINGRQILVNEELSGLEVLSTLLHEVQHGIQAVEGFATGGNVHRTGMIGPENKLKAEESLRKLVRLSDAATDEARFLVASEGDSEFVKGAIEKWRGKFGVKSDENPYGVDTVQAVQFELIERDRVYQSIVATYNQQLNLGRLSPRDVYVRLSGEVEARNTVTRQKMTDAERRITSPESTADVPASDVIVVFNGKEMMDAPLPENVLRAVGKENRQVRNPHSVESLANAIDGAFPDTRDFSRLLGQTGRFEIIEVKDVPAGLIGAQFSAASMAERDRGNIETAGRRMEKFVDAFVAGQVKDSNSQLLGDTPTVLQALGAKELSLHIDGATVRKILAGKHKPFLSAELLKQIPESLYDPLMVFNSPDKDGRPGKLMITEVVDRVGDPVVAAVHLSKATNGRYVVNDVASVYGFENSGPRLMGLADKLEYVRNEESLGLSSIPNLKGESMVGVVQKARSLGVKVRTEFDVVNQFGAKYSMEAAGSSFGGEVDIRYSTDGLRPLAYVLDGKTHLIADNIDREMDAKAVRGLLMHEIGVHALRLGRDDVGFRKLLSDFEDMREAGNPKVLAAFERVPKGTPGYSVTEEAVGYFVEANSELPFAKRVTAWLKEQVCKLANVLPMVDKVPLVAWARKLGEDDLVYMATRATCGAVNSLGDQVKDKSLPADVVLATKGMHIGKVVEVTDRHVIQDAGRGQRVAHERGGFAGVPAVDSLMEVGYKGGRMVFANEMGPQGVGLGR